MIIKKIKNSLYLKDFVSLLSGNLTQVLVGFFSNLFFVRYIAPNEFGKYAVILATIGLAFSVFSLRLGILIINFTNEKCGKKISEFYFSAIVFETFFSALVSFVCIYSLGLLDSYSTILIVASGVNHFVGNNIIFFERKMLYSKIVYIETKSHFLAHLISITLLINGLGVSSLYIRDLLLALIPLLFLYFYGLLAYYPIKIINFRGWVYLIKRSKNNWIDQTLEQLFSRSVILFAGLIGGNANAGIFFQAQRIAGVPHQIVNPLAYRFSLNLFGRERNPLLKAQKRDLILIYIGLFLLALTSVIVFFSNKIIYILFGGRWISVAPTLVYMSGAMIFISLFENLKAYCYSTKKIDFLFKARFMQLVGLCLPLAYMKYSSVLEPKYLAIGYSLAYIFSFMTLFFLLKKNEKHWRVN